MLGLGVPGSYPDDVFGPLGVGVVGGIENILNGPPEGGFDVGDVEGGRT